MSLMTFVALSPQLIIAFGLVLSMLLISWHRSQRSINILTQVILLFSLLLCARLLFADVAQVTPLLRVDGVGLYALMIILISAMVVVQLSYVLLKKHIEFHDEFYLLVQLVVLGASVLVVSDHFASLFLGFELLSIALVGLAGYLNEQKHSVETGFKYLILSATASSFMLLGIAFIYSQTGQLSFYFLPESSALSSPFYHLGIILFLVGMAFKLSLVPFHYWTPDVYQGAPTPVTLLMATVSKLAMFAVLLKCWFGLGYAYQESAQSVVLVIAILSMVSGNALALYQQNLKRLLAYSSIAHMGYLLIVLLLSSAAGESFAWQSMLFYFTAYVFATLAIFIAIFYSCSQQNSQVKNKALHTGFDDELLISDWQGLFWRSPLMAALILVSILSLAGIPLTMGFIGKFYLLSYASQTLQWGMIIALVIGSGIALFYYLKVIFVLFATEGGSKVSASLAIQARFLAITLISVSLFFGLFPDFLSQILQQLSIA